MSYLNLSLLELDNMKKGLWQLWWLIHRNFMSQCLKLQSQAVGVTPMAALALQHLQCQVLVVIWLNRMLVSRSLWNQRLLMPGSVALLSITTQMCCKSWHLLTALCT